MGGRRAPAPATPSCGGSRRGTRRDRSMNVEASLTRIRRRMRWGRRADLHGPPRQRRRHARRARRRARARPRGAGQARRELPELLVRPRRRTACSASSTRPSKEAAEAVHREAHGLTATKIIEVEGHTVMSFLGRVPAHPSGEAVRRDRVPHDPLHRHRRLDRHDAAPRRRKGDGARARPRPDRPRPSSRPCGGNEVKHTGDGIMASFASVARAIECAIAIQRGLERTAPTPSTRSRCGSA